MLSSFSIDHFGVSHSIISLTALLLLPTNTMFDLLHLELESAHPPFRGASCRAKHQPRLNRELVSSQEAAHATMGDAAHWKSGVRYLLGNSTIAQRKYRVAEAIVSPRAPQGEIRDQRQQDKQRQKD